VEVDDRRTPESELSPAFASGRDATIHAFGPDRVLRRTPDPRDHTAEADVMELVRAAGFPVPQVFRRGPGEMVMARIEGPTMLEDIEAHPWRIDRHARTLADLHARLHAIEAPEWLRPLRVPGSAVLHLDFHPGNVILSPSGPMIIDWSNAARGDPAADVALTWILMAAFERDDGPVTGSLPKRILTHVERRAEPWIRRRLVRTFVRASGLEAETRRVLGATADHRLADRSVREGEREAILALVSREGS